MARTFLSFGVGRLGLAGILVGVAAIACSQNPVDEAGDIDSATATPAELPQVVVTTSVLCDLTKQVAADTIDLTCLLEPGQDPHTYQAKPSDRQAIDEADLVLYGGYNFAPAIVGLVEASANNAPKVAVFEAAVPNPLMGEGHDHDHGEAAHSHAEGDHAHEDEAHSHAEDDDHAHEDEAHSHVEDDDHAHEDEAHSHAEGSDAGKEELVADPHIWHSATHNGAIAVVIAENLAKINPEQAQLYTDKAAQLTDLFAEIDAWIQQQVATVPTENRQLVTTHDSFRYFAEAYDFEVKGALSGLSTAERPSPKTLTDLVDQVKGAQVPAIFAESTTNPELIDAIAKDANVAVAEQPLFVEGPGTAESAAPTTQSMLVVNTCTIVNALGGTCADAEAPQ